MELTRENSNPAQGRPEIKKVIKKPDMTLIVLVAMVLIAVFVAFWKGGWQLTSLGLVQAGHLVGIVWLRLPLGFILGGLIQVLVPRTIITKLLGPTSGIKGILIGSYTAIILSGAPYVMMPVVASLYLAGAGAGPIIALLTGQTVLGLQNLIAWQIPFLGFGIPLSRYIISLFITPLIGWAGSVAFKLLANLPDIGPGQNNGEKKASQAADGRGKI